MQDSCHRALKERCHLWTKSADLFFGPSELGVVDDDCGGERLISEG